MMKTLILVLFYVLVTFTSVAQAAEVISSQNNLSNTIHIRTLAASCAACHGTNGNAVISNAVSNNVVNNNFSLAGINSQYFVAQMLAFKNGSRPATVMHHHAKGLNVDEINLLGIHFSKQKRIASQLLKPQTLNASHE